MGLFVRKSKPGLSASQQQLARRIASGLLARQRKLADKINLKIAGVSLKILIGFLFCFGCAFGIYCLYLVLSAFN